MHKYLYNQQDIFSPSISTERGLKRRVPHPLPDAHSFQHQETNMAATDTDRNGAFKILHFSVTLCVSVCRFICPGEFRKTE